MFYFHSFQINFDTIGVVNPAIKRHAAKFCINSDEKYNIGAIHAAKQLPQLNGLKLSFHL
mgnify:CR=1 FL=1